MFAAVFRNLTTKHIDPDQADFLFNNPAELSERLERLRHSPISDDAPVAWVSGFAPIHADSDALTLYSGDGSALLIKLMTESRDVDKGILDKRVKKEVDKREADGRVLDDDQVLEIQTGIKRSMLSDTPSKYSSVLILLDLKQHCCHISSASKSDLTSAAAMLRQIEIDTFKRVATTSHFARWLKDGHVGRGLMIGDALTGKRGECKLSLSGGDFGAEWLIDLLSCFEIQTLAFVGYAVNDGGAAPYVHGVWRSDGALVQLRWDMTDEEMAEISDRADYLNAELDFFVCYLRILNSQTLMAMEQLLDRIDLIEHRLPANTVTIPGDCDPALYQSALTHVLDYQSASISILQRQLKIGYNRAADLMEQLERVGVVSKPGVDGTRTVLKTKIEAQSC